MDDGKNIKMNIQKIAAPMAGIDGINQAVRALFAYKKPAFYKDLATAANMSPAYMSASLSSARDIGLTKLSGKRGLYELTPMGEQYGRLLTFGKEADCRKLLKKAILENPLWSEIVAFLRVSKGQMRDPMDLVLTVEEKLGKKWSPSLRNKLCKNYSSILRYANLVRLEKGKIISQIGIETESVETKERREELKTHQEISLQIPKEFAEFQVPDSFILYVRKDLDAITFFEQQIKKESIITPWIQFIKNKVKKAQNSGAEVV